MPGSLASQNSMMNNGPSSGVQPPLGSLLNGRIAANSLPASFSQLQYTGAHELSGVTSRGEFYPNSGNMGSRVTNSMSNFANGGSVGRSLSSAGGLRAPGLVSRISLVGNGGSADMSVQGCNRPMDGMFPQGLLQKQMVGVFQQNQEFSIQNEDFPALPRFKEGGSSDHQIDMHPKEHVNDYNVSKIQNQPLPIGRSSGFSLPQQYPSGQQQHHQLVPTLGSGGFSLLQANSQDLHSHGCDLLPSSHVSYHSQARSIESPTIGMNPINSSNKLSSVGTYDQFIRQYELQRQSQLHLQQMKAVGSYKNEELMPKQSPQFVANRFDMLGLLNVIRLSNPDLSLLSLGIDLTSLGLNLNSSEDLHKRFASPWSDVPAKEEPQYKIPECYNVRDMSLPKPILYSKLQQETLFFIFYSMPQDEAQLYVANELINRGWLYHKTLRVWLTRDPNVKPLVKTNTYERGSYYCFDPNRWGPTRKDNFVLQYELIEERPSLPRQEQEQEQLH